MENINDSQKKLIEETLDKIRPFLQRDGGDVELVDFIEGIVFIKMAGACQGCGALDYTINDGISIILMEEVPGVIEVRAVTSPEEIPQILAQNKEKQEQTNEKE